jgi:hypothetical protein
MRQVFALGFPFRAALGALAVLLALSVPVQAQLTRGIVSGTVRDASGLAVPGATVTVTNVETNISRVTVSSEVGFYRVPPSTGSYKVKFEMTGFGAVDTDPAERV